MTEKQIAKIIVKKLTQRPEAKDADGFYNLQLDIEQMEDIVEKWLIKFLKKQPAHQNHL